MQTYRFIVGTALDQNETLEFQAASLSAALLLADSKIGDQQVEVWEDGTRLARIRKARSEAGVFWQVS